MDSVGAGEEATFAVLEPFGEDLIATDLVIPEVGSDTVEVLGGVDADALVVGVELDTNAALPLMPDDSKRSMIKKSSENCLSFSTRLYCCLLPLPR